MNQLNPKDFEQYRSLSDCRLVMGGGQVLYRVTTMSLALNRNVSDLYLYDFDTRISRRLTTDGNATGFELVDDTAIRNLIKEDKATRVMRQSLITGETSLEAVLPYRVEALKPLGSDYLVFTVRHDSLLERPDLASPTDEEGTARSTLYNDYLYFDTLRYRTNDDGIIAGLRNHLYLYCLSTGECTRISGTDENVSAFDTLCDEAPNPDGSAQSCTIFYAIDDTTDPMKLTKSLWAYQFATATGGTTATSGTTAATATAGKTTQLLPSGTFDVSDIFALKGGVMWVGQDTRVTHSREKSQLYVLPTAEVNARVKWLDTGDYDINKSGASDIRLTSGPAFKKDGDGLYLTLCSDGIEALARIGLDGAIEIFQDGFVSKSGFEGTSGFDGISGFDVAYGKRVMVLLSDVALTELYLIPDQAEPVRLTGHNDAVAERFTLSGIETFEFISHGDTIKGYVMKPTNWVPGGKYPGVLFMHGGPRGLFSKVYQHKLQVLAHRGYFCFFTNPHGSAARGNAFSSIFGKFGEMDYDDLMTFTDAVLERYPELDPDRLGLTGHSYGGIMTNVIIGRTQRFKAAVSSASLANYVTKAYLTDNGLGAGMLIYGDPDGDDWCWQRSPIRRAKHIATPTLFLHGEVDYRCASEEALQMFAALKRYGVASEVYIFKGEAHAIKKPRNKVKWLEVLCDWFDRYLT